MIVRDGAPYIYTVKNRVLLGTSCYHDNEPDERIALLRMGSWYTPATLKFLDDICSESLDEELVRTEIGGGCTTYTIVDGVTKYNLAGDDLIKALQILDALDAKPLLVAMMKRQANPAELLSRLKAMDRVKSQVMKQRS